MRAPNTVARPSFIVLNFKRDRTPVLLRQISVLTENGQLVEKKILNARLTNLSGLVEESLFVDYLGLNGAKAWTNARKDLGAIVKGDDVKSFWAAARVVNNNKYLFEIDLSDIYPDLKPGDTIKLTGVATFYNLLTRVEETAEITY